MSADVQELLAGMDCCPPPADWAGATSAHILPAEAVVKLTIYFQRPGMPPTQDHAPDFKLACKNDAPFHRELTVGEDWQPLDLAWASDPALLVIANAAERFSVMPTPEQRRAAKDRVLALRRDGDSEPFARVLPGTALPVQPWPGSRWMVRCASGQTRITVTAHAQAES